MSDTEQQYLLCPLYLMRLLSISELRTYDQFLSYAYRVSSCETDLSESKTCFYPNITVLSAYRIIKLSGKCLSFTDTSFTTMHLYTNMNNNTNKQ